MTDKIIGLVLLGIAVVLAILAEYFSDLSCLILAVLLFSASIVWGIAVHNDGATVIKGVSHLEVDTVQTTIKGIESTTYIIHYKKIKL